MDNTLKNSSDPFVFFLLSGMSEYFVVDGLARIEAGLRQRVFGAASSLEETRSVSGTSRFSTYLANMTGMQFIMSILCFVVGATVVNDDVRDDTWVMTTPHVHLTLLAGNIAPRPVRVQSGNYDPRDNLRSPV